MALLSPKVRELAKKELSELKNKVRLVVFTQEIECQMCEHTRSMAEELSGLSDRLTLDVYDFAADRQMAQKYSIDNIPAIAVESADGKDFGVRFYGIPAGYEFTSLVEAIKAVGRRDSGLSPASREALRTLERRIDIKVFVTLTCPYCPAAVRTAHLMAIESDRVKAAMIEAAEFPHLAQRHRVTSVPHVVVNDGPGFVGSAPEVTFVRSVLEAAGI